MDYGGVGADSADIACGDDFRDAVDVVGVIVADEERVDTAYTFVPQKGDNCAAAAIFYAG